MGASFQSANADLQTHLKKRIWREWLLSTAVMLVLTFSLSYFNDATGLRKLDNTLYDHFSSALVHHEPSSDIIIVAIDDSSIRELGYWPWRRSLHATLLEKTAQARAVALDLLLSERNPAYPSDDIVLAEAIQAHGRVVLPLMVGPDDLTLTRPLTELEIAAAQLGYINIYPDSDGVIRSFSAQKRLTNGQILDHLSVKLLETGQETYLAERLRDRGLEPLRIAYSGFPGDYTIVPYSRVLDGSIPPSAFKDKYVLIGSWGSGLGDTFSTPYSQNDDAMSGVEILANLLNGGMTQQWISTPDHLTIALLSMLPVLLACVAFRHLSPQRVFLFTIGLFVGVIVISGALLHYTYWWLSPSAMLIGITLAYPVWSWRSQHAALMHIDEQLASLRQAKSQSMPVGQKYDQSLLTRLGRLHHAIDAMRLAQRQRNETLRFLSHDMRAPLNSILALTELERRKDISSGQRNTNRDKKTQTLAQFDYYANKTLELVDGFVALGRAESITLTLRPINLTELIIQCCADVWVHARQKRIKILTDSLPPQAWVNADAGLLARAWINLLDNALKYSPEGTVITCRLTRDGSDWLAQLQDQGRGMDTSSLASAFDPFIRFAEHSPENPTGAGLGLAFVQTVIARHSGRITVQSEEGTGTCFNIWLDALDSVALPCVLEA